MSANRPTDGDHDWLADLTIRRLVSQAFGGDVGIHAVTDAGEGRGVFSDVLRVHLSGGSQPSTVVAKLPAVGPNGDAAIATGAVDREATAYTELLNDAPVRHPRLLATDRAGDRTSFLFEDLTERRAVDQLGGLGIPDTLNVVAAIGRFHTWNGPTDLNIRSCTPALFDPNALSKGVSILGSTWGLSTALTDVFEALVAQRHSLIEQFAQLSPTICHGDLRADNLVFDPDGIPVLFDWQQIAVQTGGADVAWLLATSLQPASRRVAKDDVARAYADSTGRSLDEATAAIRLGHLLPGLAVLMLAQREPDNPRTAAFIQTSIERIALAVAEDGPLGELS